MHHFLAGIFCLILLAGCSKRVPPSSASPRKPFGSYVFELTQVALKENEGRFSDEQFRSIATALFKYLEGEPLPNEKLVVMIDPTTNSKDIISIFVGYDHGTGTRAYDFAFSRRVGELVSITPIPSA
jgi:hypothetical protein